MSKAPFKDTWVLVTGATSGLGWALAQHLAEQEGAHILAVGRRVERLEALGEVVEAAGSQYHSFAVDLADSEDLERLKTWLDVHKPSFAVLNAAVTYLGDFDEVSADVYDHMIDLNTKSLVQLTHHLAPLIERHRPGGGLLLVASLAGMLPLAYQSAYAATKAFVLNFGLSLATELDGRDVSISVLAPGGIQTEMTSGARFEELRGSMMSAQAVADVAVAGLAKRKKLIVPGFTNKLMAAAIKIFPRFLTARVVAGVFENSIAAAEEKGPKE